MIDSIKFYGIARVGSKGQIVIPVEARDQLGIKEGDKLIIVQAPQGDGVVVLKAEKMEQMLASMQSGYNSLVQSLQNLKDKDSEL